MKTDLVEIFQTIRANMQPYTANGFKACTNSETTYELMSEKIVEIEGRKREGVSFAAIKILKEKVVLYFMPAYVEEDLKSLIHPDLFKLLKGKSCFHIKKLDDTLMEQINDALIAGFTLYKQKGWV